MRIKIYIHTHIRIRTFLPSSLTLNVAELGRPAMTIVPGDGGVEVLTGTTAAPRGTRGAKNYLVGTTIGQNLETELNDIWTVQISHVSEYTHTHLSLIHI